MKICLVIPEFDGLRAFGESLGIEYAESSLTECGHDVKTINGHGGMDTESIWNEITKNAPDWLGIGVPTYRHLSGLSSLLNKNHNKKYKVLIGGHTIPFELEKFLHDERIDKIVVGEIEPCAKAIFKNSKSKILFSENTKQLDDYPIPTRSQGQVVNILSSRGCEGKCLYCSIPEYNAVIGAPKIRYRSSKSVISEIESLNKDKQLLISFVDDNFLHNSNGNIKRVIEIARFLKSNAIKWSFGCRSSSVNIELFSELKKLNLCNVGLGIESANDKVLRRYNKKTTVKDNQNALSILQKLDLSIIPYFIMFDAYSTQKEIMVNCNFLNSFDCCWPSTIANKIIPYKGTLAFEQYHTENLLREEVPNKYTFEFANPEMGVISDAFERIGEYGLSCEYRVRKLEFDCDTGKRPMSSARAARKKLSKITYDATARAINGKIIDLSCYDELLNEVKYS